MPSVQPVGGPAAQRRQNEQWHELDEADQSELERRARERKLAQRQWEQTLVGYDEAIELLYITKAELDEWTALQRVPVALHRTVRRGAQESLLALFDPAVLKAISEEQIADWRQVMAETHELPVLKRAAMKAAGALLSSPRLYRAALPLADSALRHLPRFVIYNRLNTWGRGREMPPAPGQTFHQWYAENRAVKDGAPKPKGKQP